MTNILFGVSLILCTILITGVAIYIRKTTKKSQFSTVFLLNFVVVIIWNIGMILQIFLSDLLHISPIYFDYISYIGICFLPITLLFTAILFTHTKIKFNRAYLLLFVVPIISLLVLWTNDYHHLFYINYDTIISNTTFGPYMTIHTIYSYVCIGISVYMLISYIIKNSGFFSKQSLLIALGTLIPTITNALGTFGIIELSIYVTPITYIITLLFYSIALFKLNLLNVTPIALQRIVDVISDSYIILNEDYIVTDFNRTFLTTFDFSASNLRKSSIYKLSKINKNFYFDNNFLESDLEKVSHSENTIKRNIEFKHIGKFFNLEISSIFSKDSLIGFILLFKDTTQHVQDMKTIKDNQDMLMEKERLASLGQLIGGIAHNLKTPIMSISGAAEGLSDLIREYDSSIEDPEVNSNDHHDIAKDMSIWVDKIRNYTEYMSDVITAVKGQAVVLSDNAQVFFTVEELVKRVDILMKHELKNALVNLITTVNLDPHIELKGNVNSLVQVINNMISNSIQAYNGKTNENIELIISKVENNITFSIKDFAGGLPKEVEQKLFKEMITTKGKNGTGLGLFMSYSTIRAHFNGTIQVSTKQGIGTQFDIILPIS